MEKKRIDVLLVEQGFFDSREKAKRAIMAGIVHNDHEIIDKPGTKVPVDMELFVKGTVMPYVSRGGLKLEKALKIFDISMQNRFFNMRIYRLCSSKWCTTCLCCRCRYESTCLEIKK